MERHLDGKKRGILDLDLAVETVEFVSQKAEQPGRCVMGLNELAVFVYCGSAQPERGRE